MHEINLPEGVVKMFGKVKGSNENKFNRSTKLAYMFDQLDTKFIGMIERGNGTSHTARCALAVRLMMYTGIRVGNESSAEGYMTKPHPNSKAEPKFVKTYGLTTLRREFITFKRGRCYLNFLGKKQVDNSFELYGDLAQQIKVLYQSQLEEPLFGITAYELTKFIRTSVGAQFSPKDFRTMRANIEAWHKVDELLQLEPISTKKELKLELKQIREHVAEMLNNTPAVCGRSYIDDMLFNYYETERLN